MILIFRCFDANSLLLEAVNRNLVDNNHYILQTIITVAVGVPASYDL